MIPRFFPRILLLGWMVGALIACSSSNADGPDAKKAVCSSGQASCSENSDCPGSQACTEGCCAAPVHACASQGDCCPGQICESRAGRCVDSFTECATDADCGSAGDRVCETWTDPNYGTSSRCTYRACGEGDLCGEGQRCFAGVCVAKTPCDGRCGAGEACVLASNSCHPIGGHCDASGLRPGYMAVFGDLKNAYDSCDAGALKCAIHELPPLVAADLGRHASMAASGGDIHVAMYDGTYGDLAVRTYGAQGVEKETRWLDGVPEESDVEASPNGPRGGKTAAGNDVGQYTSIAAGASGELFVAYYDATHGALRFIARAGDGTWGEPYTIDGAEGGDMGRYASLALFSTDEGQRPAIAYFQKSGPDNDFCADVDSGEEEIAPSRITRLKLATATKAMPTSKADWEIAKVVCDVLPRPVCDGCVPRKCIVDESVEAGWACIDEPSTDCAGCSSTQTCVEGVCRERAKAPSELNGIPAGVGVFPSLAFKPGSAVPYIAWYDATRGNLKLSYKEAGANRWAHLLVDGEIASGEQAGADTGKVGLYPALAFDAEGNFLLAYHDATRRALRFRQAADVSALPLATPAQPATADFIDRGANGSAGADVVLLSTADGLWAAYQNATTSDLVVSRKTEAGWTQVHAWTEGAVGFYPGLVSVNGDLFTGSALLQTERVSGKAAVKNQWQLWKVPSAAAGE